MSSPRIATYVDGVIHRGETCTGPIQLPIEQPDAFREEFNRLYGGINLRVEAIKRTSAATSDVGRAR